MTFPDKSLPSHHQSYYENLLICRFHNTIARLCPRRHQNSLQQLQPNTYSRNIKTSPN